ncbi:putative short-chain dehydrogenase [Hypoxylon cercidicola]|nr:putative short-chain dehydrogenase [Hypoxylon cercidicola]
MDIKKGTVLVTGANGGLGSAIVEQLASQPKFANYHGLYAVRDAKLAPSVKSLLSQNPSHSYDAVSLDLANLDSTLILNAGFQDFGKQVWTDDGLNMTFSANYLGHWLLTLLLLKSMNKESGRIVIVGSHPYDKRNEGTQAFDDEKYKTISSAQEDPSGRSGYRRYGAAKLFSIMMIHELQRRMDRDPVLSNICVLGVDPGTMATSLQRHAPWFIRVLLFKIIYPIILMLMPNGPVIRSTQKSASQVLEAAFETSPEFPKGLYYFDTKLLETSAESKDPRARDVVWKESIKYAHVEQGETVLSHLQ